MNTLPEAMKMFKFEEFEVVEKSIDGQNKFVVIDKHRGFYMGVKNTPEEAEIWRQHIDREANSKYKNMVMILDL